MRISFLWRWFLNLLTFSVYRESLKLLEMIDKFFEVAEKVRFLLLHVFIIQPQPQLGFVSILCLELINRLQILLIRIENVVYLGFVRYKQTCMCIRGKLTGF